MGSGLTGHLVCPTDTTIFVCTTQSNMPLTMPALFCLPGDEGLCAWTPAGRGPWNASEPQAIHPLSFLLKPASRRKVEQGVLGQARTGEDSEAQSSPYQAYHIPVHPDLTALANPIKFFSAHDKKAVKLKEAMGGQPEVCVTRSPARVPLQACLICRMMRVGGDSRAQSERHLPNPLLQQGPFPLGNHPASQDRGIGSNSNGSAGTRRCPPTHPKGIGTSQPGAAFH